MPTDKSKLESLRQQAQVQLARLGGNPDIPTTQHPQYLQAKAQVDEAQRQLDHTVVKAPFAGIVTNVPAIAPGKYLAGLDDRLLSGRHRSRLGRRQSEGDRTDLRAARPAGHRHGRHLSGRCTGTARSRASARPASQEFSLLPAQNTSGNWVKVVQRVPMRVRVDTSDKSQPPLRAGMSVEVEVDTGHARGLPHFLTSWFGKAVP